MFLRLFVSMNNTLLVVMSRKCQYMLACFLLSMVLFAPSFVYFVHKFG